MKKLSILFFLNVFFLTLAWGGAYDTYTGKVHGVNGYYYYNAKRLKAEEMASTQLFRVMDQTNLGVKGWHAYTDSLLTISFGQEKTSATPPKVYMTTFTYLRESTWGYNTPLIMTSSYPIIAVKMRIDSAKTVDQMIWVHFKAEAYKHGQSGVSSGKVWSVAADINKWKEWKNPVDTATANLPVQAIKLPANDPDSCNRIFYFNLASSSYKAFVNAGSDSIDLGRFRIDIGTSGYDTTGYNIPNYKIKWIRTYKSVGEMNQQIRTYRGDEAPDTRTDNQVALFEALYAGYQMHTKYNTSNEQIMNTYRDSLDFFKAVYDEIIPSDVASAQWTEWNTRIGQAAATVVKMNSDLLSKLTWKRGEDSYMVKLATSAFDGKYLALGGDIKVGGYAGKKLVFKTGEENGSAFYVASRDKVNGLTSYALVSDGYYIALHKDTLFAVASANRGNVATTINFTNRAPEDPYYSLNLGFYVGVTDGVNLNKSLIFPTTAFEPYLFEVIPYAYTYNSATDSIGKIAMEFNKDGDTEGWKRNNWRPYIETQQSTINEHGVLEAYATETYLANSAGSPVTETAFPAGIGLRREAGSFATGQYPNAYELNPKSDSVQHRPLDYQVVLNSGKNRYFAIKVASNESSADMSLGNFTFYRAFGEGYTFSMANADVKKNDVYVFDLLKLGIAPGNSYFVNQYIGNFPLVNKNSRIYIDWIRTYENLSDIPNESFALSSINESNSDNIGVYAYSAKGELKFENSSGVDANVNVYNVSGALVYSGVLSKVNTSLSVASGLYIVKVIIANSYSTQKVFVK